MPATLQTLSDMLSVLSDPSASKERVAEMQAATASLQRAVADQKTQMAAFIVAEAEHNSALDKKSADVAAKLAEMQVGFDTDCRRRSNELDDRDAKLTQLQTKAQVDADAAAAARADFERRLSLIKAATG